MFAGLPHPALTELARVVHRKRVPARHTLFYEGDPVTTLYCIHHGRIRIDVTMEDGGENTINILGDGEFFPHTGLLPGGTYPATATTMVETELAAILRDDLVQLVRQNPEIAYHLLLEMGRRAEILQSRVRELTQRDLRLRVLCVLMRLARMRLRNGEIPHPVPDGTGLDFHLTHEELARLSGGARESISRILADLKREGIVLQSSQGRLVINYGQLENAIANSRVCPLIPATAPGHSFESIDQ